MNNFRNVILLLIAKIIENTHKYYAWVHVKIGVIINKAYIAIVMNLLTM